MSQDDLAFKSDLSRVTISYVECGREVYFSTIESVCRGLGISMASLLLMLVDEKGWPAEKKEMFRLYLPHILEILKK